MSVASGVVLGILGLSTIETVDNFDGSTSMHWHPAPALLQTLVVLLYFGVLNGGARGQTVGKMALGIRCVSLEGDAPLGIGKGVLREFTRAVLLWLCFIPWLLDGLWPLWDQRKQALHDKTVQSRVIKAR